jgi:Dynamin family
MPTVRMHSSFATRLGSLAAWRAGVDRSVATLASWLREHDLHGEPQAQLLGSLHERLQSEKLIVAFVAEFSRGKSELINAIFFSDAGRRVLPAAPGRTTMCPVELRHDADRAPSLSLLPIETRLRGLSLAELRDRDEPWSRIPLNPGDPDGLVRAIAQVTRTSRVSVDEARALGLWDDQRPEENAPQAPDGSVEVPAWRHALINYPHPLLDRGLVIIDTPGLNAIGAEPELTLGLLPSAHATVFVLGADTGVTRSDLEVWRQYLGARAVERYVVLNKIDTLADPLGSAEQTEQQIAQQRNQTAQTLGIDVARVFPLSARDALAARLKGDAAALVRSRLPELEAALSAQLLPGQHEMLSIAACDTLVALRAAALHQLADRRRHNAEETLEMRGLRGKSSAKVRLMLTRVEAEIEDFERCTVRLSATRAVHMKLLRAATEPLSSQTLRKHVAAMQPPVGMRLVAGGALRPFETLCAHLRDAFVRARGHGDEMHRMVDASFSRLNAEFGFAFLTGALPTFERWEHELGLIERNYGQYLGLTQAWRLAAPGAMEQFRRMLLSKLRMVFESAASELELWSKNVSSQIDHQLRERRRAFRRRHDALERIQQASGELESRISELEDQEQRLRDMQQRLESLVDEAQSAARMSPQALARRDAA